jgi:hypothetical protein
MNEAHWGGLHCRFLVGFERKRWDPSFELEEQKENPGNRLVQP